MGNPFSKAAACLFLLLLTAVAAGALSDRPVVVRAVGPAASELCNGLAATMVGTAGDDVLVGTSGHDVISGLSGNDRISGLAGNDTICGDDGADRLNGGDGNDTLSGGLGNDVLNGQAGTDALGGGEDDDTLNGGVDDDELAGEIGADLLSGGPGVDLMSGGGGNDTLNGGTGTDTLDGGDGDDTVRGGEDADELDGGAGDDAMQGGGGDDVLIGNLDLDLMNGGPGSDALFGNEGDDTMNGGDGDDQLDGGSGNDKLNGGPGVDTLNGGEDNDTLNGSFLGDTLLGGAGNDTLNGHGGLDTLDGGLGDDLINAGPDADMLSGGEGNDTLNAGDGADTLSGNEDDDVLRGGNGPDSLDGGAGSDHGDGGEGTDSCTNVETHTNCEEGDSPPAEPVAVYRINAGGPDYTDSLGQLWSADHSYNTGSIGHADGPVTGTPDPVLYETERWDPSGAPALEYALLVTDGGYTVNLHFADTYNGTQGENLRVFDVLLEGAVVLDDIDIYAEVGGFTPLVKTFDVTVTDGILSISFAHEIDNPLINAIEVLTTTGGAPPAIEFDTAVLATVSGPTALAFGPDERLYVASVSGEIAAFSFDDAYNIVGIQIITTLVSLTNHHVMGLAFNPLDEQGEVRLYVTHSRLYGDAGGCHPGTSEYSGQVSVLTGPGFNQLEPVITGLPVSNHDHGINAIEFTNDGELLINVGGMTNAGVPHCALGGLPESPLSGAMLIADISDPGFNGNVSYVETETGAPNNDQSSGDIVDVAPGSHMAVFAAGMRNSWDMTLTTRELLYATDNDPGNGETWGLASTGPDSEGPVSNQFDELLLIEPGNYYGHPNRNRGRHDDRQNVYHHSTEPSIEGVFTQNLTTFPASSTNGLTEYRASTFDGTLRGALIAQSLFGTTYVVTLSEDGRSVVRTTPMGVFPGALDVVAAPGGVLFAADHLDDAVLIARPVETASSATAPLDIFPWRAPESGGQVFVIGGHGFGDIGDTSVTVGGVEAAVTSVSGARIRGTLPSFTGAVDTLQDVVVTSNGQVATLTDAFMFLSAD